MLKQIFILTLVIGASTTHADDVAALSLLQAHESGNYDCQSVGQVKMTESEDRERNVVPDVCLYKVTCNRKSANVKPLSQFITVCKLDGASCKDFSACMAEVKARSDNSITFNQGADDGKKPDPDNRVRYGEQCTYPHGPWVVYRQHPTEKWFDTVCASPIEGCALPESLKGSPFATCKAGKKVKTGVMECPPPQDCIAKAIPVKPTMTKSEAAAYAASGGRVQQSASTTTAISVVGESLATPTHLVPRN